MSDIQSQSLQQSLSSPKPSAQKHKGFGVAASPLNAVKLELAVIMILGVVLELVLDSITASGALQIAVLACYGLLASGWIVVRTRQLINKALKRRTAATATDETGAN